MAFVLVLLWSMLGAPPERIDSSGAVQKPRAFIVFSYRTPPLPDRATLPDTLKTALDAYLEARALAVAELDKVNAALDAGQDPPAPDFRSAQDAIARGWKLLVKDARPEAVPVRIATMYLSAWLATERGDRSFAILQYRALLRFGPGPDLAEEVTARLIALHVDGHECDAAAALLEKWQALATKLEPPRTYGDDLASVVAGCQGEPARPR